MCGLLLHMTIMPEVRTALELMCFAKNFPGEFKKVGNFIPFMVGLMKLVAGILTEITNILILIES